MHAPEGKRVHITIFIIVSTQAKHRAAHGRPGASHRVVPLKGDHGWRAALHEAQPPVVIEGHVERLHQPSRHQVCSRGGPISASRAPTACAWTSAASLIQAKGESACKWHSECPQRPAHSEVCARAGSILPPGSRAWRSAASLSQARTISIRMTQHLLSTSRLHLIAVLAHDTSVHVCCSVRGLT